MHSPGVCGVILATGSAESGSSPSAAQLDALISALNADTDVVLVALSGQDNPLEPVVWTRAAYALSIPAGASDAELMHIVLQEVLSRGRDAALVLPFAAQPLLTASTVRAMIESYCAAADDVWAIGVQPSSGQPSPVLLGRDMIEQFLRTKGWSSAEEVLTAHREHVRVLNEVDILAAKKP